MLRPVESTKADEIAYALEEAIVSGEIEPGSILRQESLSEQYDVSRTPIREALRRLAALGLVQFVPNRGVRVRTLSREELREAFLVRAELESLATALAVPSFDAGGARRAGGRRAAFAELTAELRGTRTREERRTRRHRRRVGAGEPRLPRRHLRAGGRAVRRAAGEERAANVLRPDRLGGRRGARRALREEPRQHSAIRGAIAAESVEGARAARPRPRAASGHLLEVILDQVERPSRLYGRLTPSSVT